MGFNDVVVESDSRAVISKLCSQGSDLSEMEIYTRDAKRLAGFFLSYIFSFVARNSNNVVHALAAEGSHCQEDQFWVEAAPPQALTLAADDKRFIVPP
ncbi:hypothetical protein V6N13_112445 [Hibiscus sabdariffa]